MLVHNFLSIGFEPNFFSSLVLEMKMFHSKAAIFWDLRDNLITIGKYSENWRQRMVIQNIKTLIICQKQYDILIDLSWVNYDAINEMLYHSTDFGITFLLDCAAIFECRKTNVRNYIQRIFCTCLTHVLIFKHIAHSVSLIHVHSTDTLYSL